MHEGIALEMIVEEKNNVQVFIVNPSFVRHVSVQPS